MFANFFGKKTLLRQKSYDSVHPRDDTKNRNTLANDMDGYLAENINKNGIYTKYYNDLNPAQTKTIKDYQRVGNLFNKNDDNNDADNNNVESLSEIFASAPELPSTIHVYRCFLNKVSFDNINQKDFKVADKLNYISTSLSYNFAFNFCKIGRGNEFKVPKLCARNKEGSDSINGLLICVIIPKGSKVLPLPYSLFNEHHISIEYEILLPSTGSIVKTNVCHPIHKVPIFIYRDHNSKDDSDLTLTEKEITDIEFVFPDINKKISAEGGRKKNIQYSFKKSRKRKPNKRRRRSTRRCISTLYV